MDNDKEITLVVGDNDCDTTTAKTAKDITEEYTKLIDAAKTKAEQVTVSSICPRMTSKTTQDNISAVNAGLNVICSDKNITFKDNSAFFFLGDGSINDGYLLNDGVHITRPAVNKLAQNLNLRVKDKAKGACKDSNRQRPDNAASRRETSRNHHRQRDTTDADRQTTHTRPDQRRRPNDSIKCFYCGETGHVKDKCRHGQQVQCNSCGQYGHKAKFCK
jgi:hypothetical protein